MLRRIAKTLAKLLLPILVDELTMHLEEFLQKDLNNDGRIGKDIISGTE